LARRLEHEGYTVRTAVHGEDALARLVTESADLILLDVMMPGMSGYEVLEALKRENVWRDIPVIMISALDELQSVVRCIEHGAEDYLPKPFDPVLLRARIGACLEKKRLRDQEVLYLKDVARVTDAAAAVEDGTFAAEKLSDVTLRSDELGRLARVFQRMAVEVRAREQRLKQQIQELRIEIDEVKKAQQVAEITETDYFYQLKQRATDLRGRGKKS
jgi:two-component system cell cycle response regulator